MSYKTFTNKLDANLNQETNFRSDLTWEDFKIESKNSAKLLIGYAVDKPVTIKHIKQFVSDNFPEVYADISSIQHYQADKAIAVSVKKKQKTKKYEELKNLNQITSSFITDDQNNLWEVDENNGKKFLRQKDETHIESILSLRKNILNNQGMKFYKLTASVNPSIGDTVKFSRNNQELSGKIIKISNSTLIAEKDSTLYEVELDDVIEIKPLKAGEVLDPKEYLKRQYGDEYAKLFDK